MIAKMTIKDVKNLPLYYTDKIPFFVNGRKIEFTKGINIIVGPNGCGKSTLLKLIAMYFHCEQGGIQKITNSSVRKLLSNDRKDVNGPKAVKFSHDGIPTFYYNSNKDYGLIGGLAAFDDDFGFKGMQSISINKLSSGLANINRFYQFIIKEIKEGKRSDIEKEIENKKKGANSNFVEMIDNTTKMLINPTIEPNRATIIIDEPEKGLDAINQSLIWKVLHKYSENFQIIVATHSYVAFNKTNREKANYIEFKEGYFDKAVELVTEDFLS